MTSPTYMAEKAQEVLHLVREDIRDGVYDPVPSAVDQLEGFADLHDYVDANDYLLWALGDDAEDGAYYALSILVDTLLREDPILLG